MTKYARLTTTKKDGDFAIVDLFTTDPADSSTPMKIPAGTAPLLWLQTFLVGLKAEEFEYFDESFREVPAGVLPGANFYGDRTAPSEVMDGTKYLNANGTDGNGALAD